MAYRSNNFMFFRVCYCVVCHRWLKPNRVHVDTCGERCFKVLLTRQRKGVQHGLPEL